MARLLNIGLAGGGIRGVPAPGPTRFIPSRHPPHGDCARPARDRAISAGTLANGLRYFIRRDTVPADRVELRLAVQAGSGLETAAQRGLAHFVEHMAFDGTTHYPNQAVVRTIEAMGLRFGADLNARTDYDATTYRLTVPTDQPGALATGARILADWAHGVTFDSAAVQAERGVILAEWRTRTNAGGFGSRVTEAFEHQLLRGSPYASRPPLGQPHVIRTAPRSELIRFYRTWYRANRMVVIVTGDVAPVAAQQLIEHAFGKIPAARGAVAMPVVPPWTGPSLVVMPDSQNPRGSVTIAYRLPRPPGDSANSLGTVVQRNLFAILTGQRLNAAHWRGVVEEPMHGMHVLVLRATGARDVRAVLADALARLDRLRLDGFTNAEIDGARAYLRRAYADHFDRRTARTSAYFASEIAEGVLSEGAMLSAHDVRDCALAALRPSGGITLSNLNTWARAILGQVGRTILVVAPARGGAPVPDASDLAELADSIERQPVREAPGAHASTGTADTITTARAPIPGRVLRVRQLSGLGAQEWVLSNGVHVVLKPTRFNSDQFLLKAQAPGGTSVAVDSEYVSAALALDAVSASGIGPLARDSLRSQLGRLAPSVTLTPFITDISEGVTGSAAPRDADALFRLVYLAFTEPRLDTAAITRWRIRYARTLRNHEARLMAEVRWALLSDNPYARPITAAMLDSLNPERALAFYRARFADAAAFTFYLVGAFSPDSMRPLVERWIGGLPAVGPPEASRDTHVRPKPGPGVVKIILGTARRAEIQLILNDRLSYSPRHAMELDAVAAIAQRRLLHRLRTELHEIYAVQVAAAGAAYPWPHATITVSFDAAPARADSMAKAALAVLDTLAARGPTTDEVRDIRAMERRRLGVALHDNGYWLDNLSGDQWNRWPKGAWLTDTASLLGSLTPDSLRAAAARWLNPATAVRITIRPPDARRRPDPPDSASHVDAPQQPGGEPVGKATSTRVNG